jgi:hypothetical protein
MGKARLRLELPGPKLARLLVPGNYRLSPRAARRGADLKDVLQYLAVPVAAAQLADEARAFLADYGKGFDPDNVPRGHLGLSGMRQRIDRFSGEPS